MATKETKEIIAAMLKENTGRHFLDSGGAYGRNWERNHGRDFEKEQESTLNVRYGYIEVSHNVYHWLSEKLTFAEEMQKLFDGFVRWYDLRNEENGWLFYADEFPRWLNEKFGVECAGLYGDSSGPMTVNTYNNEDLLSQTIQYVYFELQEPIEFSNLYIPDDCYVLLQIHGGCDVRGGYTAPKCFTLNDEVGIFDNARASIGVNDEEIYWTTDDGYHWYEKGCSGYGAGKQLETYDIVEPDEIIPIRVYHTWEWLGFTLHKPANEAMQFLKWYRPFAEDKGLDVFVDPYIINDDGVAVWSPTMGQMHSYFH